jgi:hypothetical protein
MLTAFPAKLLLILNRKEAKAAVIQFTVLPTILIVFVAELPVNCA